MTTIPVETSDVPVESGINKLKRFVIKHKTTLILGTALAASVTLSLVRKPLLPPPSDANWYALTHEDVEYLNNLLEEDQKL